MKKAGILTFQFAHNYGAQLQAYALKTTLKGYGVDTNIINFLPKGLWENYSINPIYSLKKHQFKKLLYSPMRMLQVKKFTDFQKQYLEVNKPIYELTNTSLNKYDALIVGSDQVWNDVILPDISPYFLENIIGIKKMTYAASFGTDNISDNVKNKILKNIPEFDSVTVREKQGVQIIQKIVPQCTAKHVCDPVFLLRAETWRNLYNRERYSFPDEDYILYIDLRNDTHLIMNAKQISKQKQMKVYYVHPTCLKTSEKKFSQLYDVGPLEYLSLIDHAQYIVTNSYHAIAFSCIFGKKAIHLADISLGNRVFDLLNAIEVYQQNGIYEFDAANIARRIDMMRHASLSELQLMIDKLGV